jgi:hypothetical protein
MASRRRTKRPQLTADPEKPRWGLSGLAAVVALGLFLIALAVLAFI